MFTATTLTELIESNRNAPTHHHLCGRRAERAHSQRSQSCTSAPWVSCMNCRSLGAKPGDKLILFLADNEQFIDAFWAAILGGIIPVPVAPGISDEHRRKLLRIARKLGKPFIYTDRRSLERVEAFAAQAREEAAVRRLAEKPNVPRR